MFYQKIHWNGWVVQCRGRGGETITPTHWTPRGRWMMGRAGTAKGVSSMTSLLGSQEVSFGKGRESEGGEGTGSTPARDRWMTGRAGTAKGVSLGLLLPNREGRVPDPPDLRLVDDRKCSDALGVSLSPFLSL